ncbi:MAG TPA: hypothetical protein VHB21_05595, partial [Minicystis sp.]|nr:hypothetical protein [Minicystis sp.]
MSARSAGAPARARRLGVALGAAAIVAALPRVAGASGFDSPENGIEQMGRGSAWVARADDPLAVHYNPAAIAFQATSLHLGSTFMFASRCFDRRGPGDQPV